MKTNDKWWYVAAGLLFFVVLMLAAAASLQGFEGQRLGPMSTVRVEACSFGRCAAQFLETEGTFVLDYQAETDTLTLHDFDLSSPEPGELLIQYEEIGDVTGIAQLTATRMSVAYAGSEPIGPVRGQKGVFELTEIPLRIAASATFLAEGSACTAVRGAGHDCFLSGPVVEEGIPSGILRITVVTVGGGPTFLIEADFESLLAVDAARFSITSSLVTEGLSPAIFADGFESGDTSRW